MEPTREEIDRVYCQWNELNQLQFTEALYKEMFTEHPEWATLFMFKGAYQMDPDSHNMGWKKQFVTTANAFDKILRLANFCDTSVLKDELRELANRHVVHNVGPNEFKAVKPLIIAVVKKHAKDPDMDAWDAVMNYVCTNIVV